ncbi:MAG: Crp/Fnr family transcriptional regulator [Magnetospirillum sp.]|nr:Crp/Fnr family transcriptional regulator [Magnetospirillum sp.]
MRRGLGDPVLSGRTECGACVVRGLALFEDLREQDFRLIHMPIEEMHLDAEGTLYRAGDKGNAVFTVRSGLIKLVLYLPDGNQRIVRLLRPGTTVGLEVLAGKPYQHTAVALQPVAACRIPREVIDRLSRETSRMHRQLMAQWEASVTLADECLAELNTGTARQRVARLFLQLLSGHENGRCGFLRREDVGALLSVTTETACRAVAELKRSGVVVEVGANVFDCDRQALMEIARAG